MKHFSILFCLLLSVVVCSCKKTPSPQDLLVGTWQLTKTESKGEIGGTSASKTYLPETDTFIVFESNGNGRSFSLDYNRNFTYVFNDVINNLIMTYEGGKSSSVIVEVLTENSLVLHFSGNSTVFGIALSTESQSYYTRVK